MEGTIKCSEKWEKRIGLDLVPEEERLAYTNTLPNPDDTVGGNSIQHQMKIGADRFDLEYRVKTVDRGYIWTQNRGKIVYNEHGEAIKVYAATLDITERKQTEEALRDSQATLEGFYNSSPFMMGVAELKDNEIIAFYGNKAVERFFHQPHNQLPGLTGSELGMPKEVNRLWIENYLRSQREDMPVCFEYQHMSQHGLVWLSANVSFIGKGVNGLPRFSFVAEEITDRKLAEEELRESERIAVDLVEKLRIADKNKNDFINMLSHELRNPLASIMMSLCLMEKISSGEKREARALEIAKRQGIQLTNLIDDLLDITRITQNKVILKKETVEINNLIDKAVQDYQSQFIDKNVKLKVQLTTPLYIEADPSRITQVIGNLLHNAAKFTSNNDLVTITVSHEINSNQVLITVQDTGRGIAPEFLENLFEPFIQIDKSLDRSLGGLGLGLAIVKRIVELHGGKVQVFSEGIGKGAKFTIWLPLSEEQTSKLTEDEGFVDMYNCPDIK